MSDHLSPEDIEHIKSRDARFRVFGEALAIEGDLRDNATIKAILAASWAEANGAIEELAEVSPTDIDAISKLLVKVRSAVYIRRSLNAILMRGKVAEADIRQEDDHRGDER